jgi:hypothetical protein
LYDRSDLRHLKMPHDPTFVSSLNVTARNWQPKSINRAALEKWKTTGVFFVNDLSSDDSEPSATVVTKWQEAGSLVFGSGKAGR